MSDTEDEKNDKKPDLKVVSINTLLPEEEDLQTQLVQLYTYCRQVFLELDDIDQHEEAVSHLRSAFLTALNPLRGIDDQFEIYIEEEED